jgi:hypothetical protein
MICFSLIEYEFEFFFLIIFISFLIQERHESSSIQKWHESENHYRNFLIVQEIVRLFKWCEIIALTAKRFCKSSMTCRNRVALTAKRHEFDRLRFKKRDRRIKLALGLLAAKIRSLIEIETQKQSSIKLKLGLLVARFRLISDEIRSNALCDFNLISSRSSNWLRLKKVDRQSASFFVVVCYRLLICDH